MHISKLDTEIWFWKKRLDILPAAEIILFDMVILYYMSQERKINTSLLQVVNMYLYLEQNEKKFS